jgi:sterol desaturase/sphingolipid hydroxylase (fatty acid hydroxylase superfamily)
MDLQQRTDRFRQQYRSGINRWYSGIGHMLFVFGFGGAMMLYSFLQLESFSATVIAAVAFAMLLGNIGEYLAHKSLGHKKRRFAGLFYSRHSGDHHTFFTDQDYTISNLRDLRVVLFPAFLLVAVTLLIALPLALLARQVAGENAGWAMAGGVLLAYLFYEFVHLCDHLPDGNILTQLPGIRALRAHHRHHHAVEGRDSNFNVTIPLSDWLLGTKAAPQD